jgi:ParB/RepB/Spo0J family partition protein
LSKRKNSSDLEGLLDRYQRLSVVSEIEKNLSSEHKSNYLASSLYLSDLYDAKNYDLKAYPTLEESLRKDGFLIPLIIVKGPKEGTFEIINGVKRFLFSQKLGMNEVPCVLADISPERKVAYVVENIIEEGGCPLSKTTCFERLKSQYGYTEEMIGSLTHLSLSQIRNLLRLAKLPESIKDGLRSYKISYGEARVLVSLAPSKQEEIYQELLTGRLSVRELEGKKRSYLGKARKTGAVLKGRRIILTFQNESDAKRVYPRIVKEFSD